MNKMVYQKPLAELVQFESEDIIMATPSNPAVCPYNPGAICDHSDEDVNCRGQNYWCGNDSHFCYSLWKLVGKSTYSGGVRTFSDGEDYGSGIDSYDDDGGEWW